MVTAIQRQQRSKIMRPRHVRVPLEYLPANFGGGFTIADSNSISMSIGRLPNGIDSNTNSADFNSACITPGSGNISGTGDCSISVSAVPLPAAAWLFGSGLLGLIGISRRRLGELAR